jgi:hypothetical protein
LGMERTRALPLLPPLLLLPAAAVKRGAVRSSTVRGRQEKVEGS